MDGANPPALRRARQHCQFCTHTADCSPLKGAGDLRSRGDPSNVAREHHLQRAGLGGDGSCELNIGWQMMRPVLCPSFDTTSLQDDCILSQKGESGSRVATRECVVESANRFADRDGVGGGRLRR